MDTTDRRIASDRALSVLDEWKREWAALRGETLPVVLANTAPILRTPTDHELDEAAVVLGYELPLSAADTGRRTLAGKGSNMYHAHVNFVRAELEEQVRVTATGDDALVRSLAEEAMTALGVDLAHDSEGYRNLIDRLNAARLAGLQAQHRRNVGDVEAVGESSVIERVRQRQMDIAAPGETIHELFDRYGRVRVAAGRKRPDSITQDRIVVHSFAGFVGQQRRLSSITRPEVRGWRDTMAAMPRNARNSNAYRDLDMRAAVAKAEKLDAQRLSPKTVNSNLSALSSFLRWAVSEGVIEANPCDDLALSIAKDTNQRNPFSVEQLNAILQSPLYTGFVKDGAEHKAGNEHANDWRRWIPLVCMFTGARVGEIAQLVINDIEMLHGRWFIHIRDDVKTGQRTKSGKSRMVPVHPTLKKMGFIRFYTDQVETAKHDRSQQLFPELVTNSRDHIGAQPSKWWRRYLGKIGVKEGSDGLGAHAFRHTIADELRAAGFLDAQFGPMILGHNKGGVTGKYGRVAQGTAEMLCTMMDGVKFAGVDFAGLVEYSHRALAEDDFPREARTVCSD